ncbi:DNA/RNA helicase domain-containing protein [Actinosynnema sp. CA-248983]
MQVYLGTVGEADESLRSAPKAFVERCAEDFRRRRGEPPGDAELRSWRNSWPALVDALVRAGLRDLALLFEYELPRTSERVDALVLGARPDGGITGVVVELKQWDEIATAGTALVETRGEHRGHPCRQAAGYVGHLEQWLEDEVLRLEFRGAAVLHNADDRSTALLAESVQGSVGSGDVPVLGRRELAEPDPRTLAGLLRCDDLVSPAEAQMAAFLALEPRPSTKLLDGIGDVLDQRSRFRLIGAQLEAQALVWKAATDVTAQRKRVIVVSGGPGTGKSVIALRLVVDLTRRQSSVKTEARYLTPSGTLLAQLKRDVEGVDGAKGMFGHPSSHPPSTSVVPVVDEAQRLERNDWQLERLMTCAPVSVFMLDERQVILPKEGYRVAELREAALRLGAEFHHVELESQFRCGGSQSYLNWLGRLLSADKTPVPWTEPTYDFDIARDPDDLDAWIRHHGAHGFTARIAAGFCWDWTEVKAKQPLVDNVVLRWTDRNGVDRIWRRPWNAHVEHRDPTGTVTAPGRKFWATDAGGQNQVGCVYTCQGLEYDYGGVIIGPDLVWRDDRWVAQPTESADDRVNWLTAEEYLPLALNIYWVLASRAMLGCRLYSTDAETQDFLLRLRE